MPLLRGSKHLNSNTPTYWAVWIGCTFGITVTAYIIASAIPVFEGLVSLVGALLGTFISFQPMPCMWLYDNWSTGKARPTTWWYLTCSWAFFVIASGTFLLIAGTYGSIVGIITKYAQVGGSAAWSCADNSNSVGRT